nr:serine/threonine protein kinase [Ardenticatenales bacterium]
MLAPDTLIHNRYRIVRLMGEGGMGTVYEAIDERLGYSVALKQTLVGGPAPMEHTFEREAQQLARLRHPALPVVSDFFTDEAGQFLVTSFVPGDDLAKQLAVRGKAFFLEQMLRWADELLDVLEYLHSRQTPVLHRDIKPQNLKVGKRGELILLDLGLVKDSPLPTSHARGVSSGFGYTPLEQIQGEGTDPRSDLYALAATLYHLATNHPPADALRRASYLARRQPDPLRPPREINPLLPFTFANLLIAALSLDPAGRPSSAQAMRFAMYEERTGKAKALPILQPAVERTMPIVEKAAAKPKRQSQLITALPEPTQPLPHVATRSKNKPIWYLWMAGATLAIILFGGGAWWLAA